MSHQGRHYQAREVAFLPKPVQVPRIPIWVAGYWPNRRPFRRAARYEGILPGKVNEEDLTPRELGDIISYVHSHRSAEGSFDVAVYGHTPANPTRSAEVIRPWIEAGATWWREGIGEWRDSIRTMRARIRGGPPLG